MSQDLTEKRRYWATWTNCFIALVVGMLMTVSYYFGVWMTMEKAVVTGNAIVTSEGFKWKR